MSLIFFSQYYMYITDTRCKRVGTQCWVYGAIMVSEAILCIKNGKDLFEHTQAINIVVWLIVQMAVSIIFLCGCVFWHKYVQVSGGEGCFKWGTIFEWNISIGQSGNVSGKFTN